MCSPVSLTVSSDPFETGFKPGSVHLIWSSNNYEQIINIEMPRASIHSIVSKHDECK